MPGHGRVPKLPHERRNTTKPQRGEWVELEPLAEPVLEPANPRWCIEARRLWEAMRADPVSTQLGPVDIQMLKETMRIWRRLQPSEQRLRMDAVGGSPKGKRDLRWRTPAEVKTIQKAEAKAAVKRLRVVAPEEEAS